MNAHKALGRAAVAAGGVAVLVLAGMWNWRQDPMSQSVVVGVQAAREMQSQLDPGSKESGREPEAMRATLEVRSHDDEAPSPTRAARIALRVMDAATGAELNELFVIGGLDWMASRSARPREYSAEHVIFAAARSPLLLDVPVQVGELAVPRTLFVRNPDHAWGRVVIEASMRGERILTLEPAGGLDVLLLHEGLPGEAVFRARRVEGGGRTPEVELPLEQTAELAIEAMPVGRYEVAVEVGHWFRDPLVLAREFVDVFQGRRSLISLAPVSPAAEPMSILRGILAVPTEWDLHQHTLFLESTDSGAHRSILHLSPESVIHTDGLSSVYEWNAGMMKEGAYSFFVNPPMYCGTLQHDSSTDTETEIRVPSPTFVSIVVLDSATGEPADIDSLAWRPVWPEGTGRGALVRIPAGEAPGTFELIAPVGKISLMLGGDTRYRTTSIQSELEPGANELVVNVSRASGVLVRRTERGARIPWGQDWTRVSLAPVGSNGRVLSSFLDGDAYGIQVSAPGLYRLSMSTPAGFSRIDDRLVSIQADGFAEEVIPLERLH